MSVTLAVGQKVMVRTGILNKIVYRVGAFVQETPSGDVEVLLKPEATPYVVKPEQVFVNGRRYTENPLPVTFAKVGDVLRDTGEPEGTPRQLTIWLVDATLVGVKGGTAKIIAYKLVNVATGKIRDVSSLERYVWGS